MSTPHRCPVCGGKGMVPAGFYQTNPYGSIGNTDPETCRACDGGIVWDGGACPSPHVTVSVRSRLTDDHGNVLVVSQTGGSE